MRIGLSERRQDDRLDRKNPIDLTPVEHCAMLGLEDCATGDKIPGTIRRSFSVWTAGARVSANGRGVMVRGAGARFDVDRPAAMESPLGICTVLAEWIGAP